MSKSPSKPAVTHSYVAYLRRHESGGALYTQQIAAHFGMRTATAYRELRRLEKSGEVRRVATGNPVSWSALPRYAVRDDEPREPEFLPDRSGVYLQGIFAFDDLMAILLDERLRPSAPARLTVAWGIEREIKP